MVTLHGSCVSIEGRGVLLRGPSGSGKSDLALRLIDTGAQLVADDYVAFSRRGELVWAEAPARIAGLLEVRGAGLIAMPRSAGAVLRLVIDLDPTGPIERLPEPATASILAIALPCYVLEPFAASAPAKIRVILDALDKAAFRTELRSP